MSEPIKLVLRAWRSSPNVSSPMPGVIAFGDSLKRQETHIGDFPAVIVLATDGAVVFEIARKPDGDVFPCFRDDVLQTERDERFLVKGVAYFGATDCWQIIAEPLMV